MDNKTKALVGAAVLMIAGKGIECLAPGGLFNGGTGISSAWQITSHALSGVGAVVAVIGFSIKTAKRR